MNNPLLSQNRNAIIAFILLMLMTLACASTSTRYSTPPLASEAYATCVTPTPIPTFAYSVLVGTATPLATNPTEPGDPIYETEYTTPVPTATPYYKVETFYRDQLVHLDGWTIKLTGWGQSPDPDIPNNNLYYFTFVLKNRTGGDKLLPLSNMMYIREIETPDSLLIGRWQGDRERGDDGDYIGWDDHSERERTIVISAPAGEVQSLAIISTWRNGLEAGVPVWFVLEDGPVDCPHGWADYFMEAPPPPPTPAIIGFGGSMAGSGGVIGELGACGAPAQGTITRGFGCSAIYTGINDPNGCTDPTPWWHNGLDIGAPSGTSVFSPISGIASVGSDGVRGNYVLVSGNGGERHDLLHLSSQAVSSGQPVQAGELVGNVGSTGNSTGAHLHWTVRVGGSPIDPLTWGGCQNTQADTLIGEQ